MSGRYLFDTNTIIYFLKGVEPWVRFVEDDTEHIHSVSVITRMELLAWPGLTAEGQIRINEFLSELTVVPLNEAVEMTAITLRRLTRLKLPDCIVVASAIHTDSTIITRDAQIVNLNYPGLKALNPLNG